MFTEITDDLSRWFYSFPRDTRLTGAAVVVALVVAILYLKIIFGSTAGFKEDVENDANYNHQLGWFNRLLDNNYDYVESEWSRLKIVIWILLSGGCGLLAYHQLPGWFPNLFR